MEELRLAHPGPPQRLFVPKDRILAMSLGPSSTPLAAAQFVRTLLRMMYSQIYSRRCYGTSWVIATTDRKEPIAMIIQRKELTHNTLATMDKSRG